METLEILALGRQLFPRLMAVVVILGFILAPHCSAGLIERAAQARARQITKALDQAVHSAFDHSSRHRRQR